MIKKYLCLAFIISIGTLVACTEGPPKLPIPEYFVVSGTDTSEITLIDFVKTHFLTALFYVDGDCSPCLAELNGWQCFFADYSRLTPLLVVRTEYPAMFPVFLDIHNFSFATLYDFSLSLWTNNHFAAVASLIVLNSEAEILYAGKPDKDTSFARRYKTWVNQPIDQNNNHINNNQIL